MLGPRCCSSAARQKLKNVCTTLFLQGPLSWLREDHPLSIPIEHKSWLTAWSQRGPAQPLPKEISNNKSLPPPTSFSCQKARSYQATCEHTRTHTHNTGRPTAYHPLQWPRLPRPTNPSLTGRHSSPIPHHHRVNAPSTYDSSSPSASTTIFFRQAASVSQLVRVSGCLRVGV